MIFFPIFNFLLHFELYVVELYVFEVCRRTKLTVSFTQVFFLFCSIYIYIFSIYEACEIAYNGTFESLKELSSQFFFPIKARVQQEIVGERKPKRMKELHQVSEVVHDKVPTVDVDGWCFVFKKILSICCHDM